MNGNVEESIRVILGICDKSGGLAQYQIVEMLPDSSPKKVVSALKKMSKDGGEIENLYGGITRVYRLVKSPRYSAKDYKGYHSLSMA